MKKVLMAFGGIFVILIIIVAGFVGYIALFVGPPLDKSSKEYVNENIPAIISTWDEKEIISRASSEFMASGSPEELSKLFKMFSKLGKLKSYEGCNGDSNVQINIGSPNVITAAYVADATFENGQANIKLQLIQKEGKWEILSIYVSSPAFIP